MYLISYILISLMGYVIFDSARSGIVTRFRELTIFQLILMTLFIPATIILKLMNLTFDLFYSREVTSFLNKQPFKK